MRQAILGAVPVIAESIQWNMPSFCTTAFFATTDLTGKGGTAHSAYRGEGDNACRDATESCRFVRFAGVAGEGLRARFADLADVKAQRTPLQALFRGWIKLL